MCAIQSHQLGDSLGLMKKMKKLLPSRARKASKLPPGYVSGCLFCKINGSFFGPSFLSHDKTDIQPLVEVLHCYVTREKS